MPPRVSFPEAFRFWLKLGFINFGGPAGQIAIMHRELVERKKWIGEEQFLRALNFCMFLPGPEAQQLAIYVGSRLNGTPGGIAAGALFVTPSIFVMLLLSWLAVTRGDLPVIRGLFYGIQCVVIAIVAEAVLRIGRRALHHRALLAFPAGAFVALYVFKIHFPWVVLAAGLAGFLLERRWPEIFRPRRHAASAEELLPGEISPEAPAAYPPFSRAVKIAALFLVLWGVPFAALYVWRGGADTLVSIWLFFTKAAFVTFGGAYAVLSYIADVAVNHFHWLNAHQMVEGLGLAETTPGPLIMVTQYVGFLGAWNFHGAHGPLANAILGALITTYVTFLPCFFFIFVGSPYIEALASNRRLQAALAGITAAIVGVILNLAVFFAGKVFFATGSLDYFAVMLAAVSFILLLRFKVPMYVLVPAAALAGLAWKTFM
ncbi:MAG TPA: chromate efflux transporter [Candidatus Acidoferrales bacterium]|nr:chromate efflux transporter [Candidatus Acidoferrales bacterium]